ncbi:ABC transporter substrate-binding protein [Paraclostridium ghonii]|uniref:ABC transporter substrate-binding protein n=1 Tax=Paraclostridium ghonii TaxID=29358 RepID=UPI00202D07C0|nr:ABC transporter substrate-binding protein [Paeniclostridium ghonii]MCM0165855.1 ABC transporter substrate-binding protein [Paeniclostridium ghonii]
MKIAKRLITLGLISTMLFAVGCSSKGDGSKDSGKANISSSGNNITLVAGGNPQTTNPLYANDRTSMTLMNAIYSPLYVIDGEKKTFYLAEKVDVSDDYLTYKVKLKDNLKWHDGKPITSDDIIFTYNAIMDKNQNSIRRADFLINEKPVEFKKIDDKNFEVKLSSVSMAFEDTLSSLRPIPKHIFEGEKDIAKSDKNNAPIGSGPYKLKEIKSGESILLEKNKDYFLGEPQLDTVAYRIMQDKNSSTMALQNGEVQANYVKPDQIETMSKNKNLEIKMFDEGMVDNLVMCEENKALANKEVRQAIAYAINKDQIMTSAYGSDKYAEKAYSLFAPNTLYYTDDVEKYDYNKDKSKDLLKSAGYENLKLRLGYINGDKTLEAIALVIQNNLKEIGITVDLVPLEKSAFLSQLYTEDLSTRTFDMVINGYVMGNEPAGYESIFTNAESNNVQGYSNEEVNKLFKEASIETDSAKRSDLYKKIQQKIVEDVALYPIAYPKSMVAIDKQYTGIDEAKLVPIYMFQDLSKLNKK